MASFTVTKSGFLTDLTIYSGSPSTAPTDGDSINIGAYVVCCDKSIDFASVTSNGGTLQATNGNVLVQVDAATFTGKLGLRGSPQNIEWDGGLAAGKVKQGLGSNLT